MFGLHSSSCCLDCCNASILMALFQCMVDCVEGRETQCVWVMDWRLRKRDSTRLGLRSANLGRWMEVIGGSPRPQGIIKVLRLTIPSWHMLSIPPSKGNESDGRTQLLCVTACIPSGYVRTPSAALCTADARLMCPSWPWSADTTMPLELRSPLSSSRGH